jgi:hypothetical protein
MPPLPRIVKAEHLQPGWARFYFDDGKTCDLEWRLFADKGTVFESLRDPSYADQWQVEEFGHGVVWPDGVDWSAGAVYLSGRPVKTEAIPQAAVAPHARR